MADILVEGKTELVDTPTDKIKSVPKQLYLVHMLCGDCYHRFNQVTRCAGYRWHRCPKCGGYFAKKVWGTQAAPLERQDSEDKAG
jgi:NMD protein affecting ribosome stability and mRNA decay